MEPPTMDTVKTAQELEYTKFEIAEVYKTIR
jgi:hypothetical protein